MMEEVQKTSPVELKQFWLVQLKLEVAVTGSKLQLREGVKLGND